MLFIRTKEEVDHEFCLTRMLLHLQRSILDGDNLQSSIPSHVDPGCFDYFF